MTIAIGVMGSSTVASGEVAEVARGLGFQIARHGAILITGATTGLPLLAAEGAKQAGGQVIGFSPALNMQEHVNMGLPVAHHDLIICTGLSFKGRNLLNVRASDGILFVGGSMGALNEFTIAYDEQKIIGIVEGSGGFCNYMRDWIRVLGKPNNRAVIHYNADPNQLVQVVFQTAAAKE